jgi:hypothetical protein
LLHLFYTNILNQSKRPITNNLIEISHKGVFINNYHSDFFGQLIGKINLNVTQKLNYSRSQLINKDYLENTIIELSKTLIMELFQKFATNVETLHILTNWFIFNYVRSKIFIKKDLTTICIHLFHCKIRVLDDFKIQPLKSIMQYEEFNIVILPSSKDEDKTEYHTKYFTSIRQNFIVPTLITTRKNFSFYNELMKHKKYDITIESNQKISYLKINTSLNVNKYQKIESSNIIDFKENNFHFLTIFNNNKNSNIPEIYINSNHRIFRYYQDNLDNENIVKVIIELFKTVHNDFIVSRISGMQFSDIIDKNILFLNRILNELNEPKLLLTKKDYPEWLFNI